MNNDRNDASNFESINKLFGLAETFKVEFLKNQFNASSLEAIKVNIDDTLDVLIATRKDKFIQYENDGILQNFVSEFAALLNDTEGPVSIHKLINTWTKFCFLGIKDKQIMDLCQKFLKTPFTDIHSIYAELGDEIMRMEINIPLTNLLMWLHSTLVVVKPKTKLEEKQFIKVFKNAVPQTNATYAFTVAQLEKKLPSFKKPDHQALQNTTLDVLDIKIFRKWDSLCSPSLNKNAVKMPSTQSFNTEYCGQDFSERFNTLYTKSLLISELSSQSVYNIKNVYANINMN